MGAPVDALRYAIAVFLVVGLPPALLFWLLVHPFAHRWRRLGTVVSLTLLYGVTLSEMVGLFLARDWLVVGDLGANALCAGLGLACFAASIALFRAVRRELPLLLAVVALEERELSRRFGAAYDVYCERVPRFIPRLGR